MNLGENIYRYRLSVATFCLFTAMASAIQRLRMARSQ